MEFHEAANFFPLMEGADFESLVADIKKHGRLIEPIWTLGGKILDGRNRYRACVVAGVKPTFREWKGDVDPFDFVSSANLERRQLAIGQRAMIANELSTLRPGQTVMKINHAAGKAAARSQAKAAEMMDVSRQSVQDARVITNEGEPDLVAAPALLVLSAPVRSQASPHFRGSVISAVHEI